MKSKLRKLLKENQFVFTAETSPPDSGNKDVVLVEVECLSGLADAINVTDGAGAKSVSYPHLTLPTKRIV